MRRLILSRPGLIDPLVACRLGSSEVTAVLSSYWHRLSANRFYLQIYLIHADQGRLSEVHWLTVLGSRSEQTGDIVNHRILQKPRRW